MKARRTALLGTVLVIVAAIVGVSTAQAGERGNLETNSTSDSAGPPTSSMSATGSTDVQPVNAVNLPIDEDGNLKVAKYVRNKVITLLDEPLTIAPYAEWSSDWFECSDYTSLTLGFNLPGAGGHEVLWRFLDHGDHEFGSAPNSQNPGIQFGVRGRWAKVRFWANQTEFTLDHLHVLLRAE